MASREALEQQKAYHLECINTKLDAMVPVSRLIPPELLSEIFLHTAGHRADPARPPPLRNWIYVTHVCRHWRETALQSTALWSRVVLPALPERITEFLVRSKDVPLSMTLSFYSSSRFHSFGRPCSTGGICSTSRADIDRGGIQSPEG
ncbi:hypothetical protein C8Q72DRAFT_461307 [Fomitopsis betulina]|nr:hypothetical protein C8Q72DRAFT_461307 [Fomitopsis betulina]